MALGVTDLDERSGRQPNVSICNTKRDIWPLTVTNRDAAGTAGAISQSVTTTMLNGLQVLQIETKRPGKFPNHHKGACLLCGDLGSGIEKVPAGRVFDGDFAV